MSSFESFGLNEAYTRVQKVGDKLADFETLIEWEIFRPILEGMYQNTTEKGGRPNIDVIVMFKILVLQSLYSLSDPELERQVLDRISFRKFIGFSEKVPDFSTVWKFKERLIQTGKEKELWDGFQQQLDLKGLQVKKGVIQDASIITAEPGKSKGQRSRGEEAKTRRSKDGTWTKKGKKSYFGYKVHTKMDYEHSLIRDCHWRCKIPHFRRDKNPHPITFMQVREGIGNAENGGISRDSRPIQSRTEHKPNCPKNRIRPENNQEIYNI